MSNNSSKFRNFLEAFFKATNMDVRDGGKVSSNMGEHLMQTHSGQKLVEQNAIKKLKY